MLPQPTDIPSASSSSSSSSNPLQTSSTSMDTSGSATLPIQRSASSSNGQFPNSIISNNILQQPSSSIQGSVTHVFDITSNNPTQLAMTNNGMANNGTVFINTTGAGIPSTSHTSSDARLSVTPNTSLPSSTPVIVIPPPPVGTQHTTEAISTIKSATTSQGGLGSMVNPSTSIQGGTGGIINPTRIQGGMGGIVNPSTSIQGGMGGVINPRIQGGMGGVINPRIQGGMGGVINPRIQGGMGGVINPSTSSSNVHSAVSASGAKQGSDDVEEALRGLMDNGLLDLPFFTL